MSDIFLSYADEDLERIRPLVRVLEERGWSVWWDHTLAPGSAWMSVIEAELDAARCVVVAWSHTSVLADGVCTEAEEGRQRRILAPVLLDADARIPLGFRLLQAARLCGWSGAGDYAELARLLQTVTGLLSAPSPPVATAPTPLAPRATAPAPVLPVAPPPPPVSRAAEVYVNSLDMVLVRIAAGSFLMGSVDRHQDERPVHRVEISQPFYLGQGPVTQSQWEAVMGGNPSRFKGNAQRPVESVSWTEVQVFLQRLNAREGTAAYRLPTEAEWEYAARAGSAATYSFGDDSSQLSVYAWYSQNAEGASHPAGRLRPNAWGLYDMHGNVWEWMQDWYAEDAYPQRVAAASAAGSAAEATVDPVGPTTGLYRVVRGGCWLSSARSCRSAYRSSAGPGGRLGYLGFRLLMMTQ